jgi:dihydroxyacid dehydratase/phosphogluconate dehydratase
VAAEGEHVSVDTIPSMEWCRRSVPARQTASSRRNLTVILVSGGAH